MAGGLGFRLLRTGSWAEARKRFGRAGAELRARQILAIKRAALLLERNLKKGIQSGAPGNRRFKPLALATVLLRRQGSSAPLLDKGDLLGSIHTVFDERRGEAFVGVNRAARNARGDDLSQIALVHEYGSRPFAIPVTPALRRLFLFLYIASKGQIMPLSRSTVVIHHPGVPARPFMAPTLAASRQNISREIQSVLSANGGPI